LECKECYSGESRITPLLKSRECLESHRQYVCNTCGRCICASVDDKGRYRAAFPFKTLDIAKLYLRSAEVITRSKCSIYEIVSSGGRKSYKIFKDQEALELYLKKNKSKTCMGEALFSSTDLIEYKEEQLRFLSKDEICQYIEEQKNGA